MAALWDLARAYGASMSDDEGHYEDAVECGQYDADDLEALASFNDATPKPERDTAQGYIPAGYAHKSNHTYDPSMSTPPLSPSTTISSLPTDEGHFLSDPTHEDREEIRRGKQPVIPDPEEETMDEYAAAQDEDWYGMQYALEQSRYEYPGSTGVWPPTAGESSTSDAAFVTMYNGYIYPQDVEYWYQHWCKWHRALAREEKRRRDRAASDAKRMRAYNHATYVEWERSQNKKASILLPRGSGCRRVKANDLDPSPLVDLPVLGTAKHQSDASSLKPR